MSVRTELKGFKECRETLQELSRAVQKNVGRRSLMPAAEIGAAAVRARAPVSSRPDNPTPGSLKGSISVVPAKGRIAKVAILADDLAAVFNEYGTVKMEAQPFFRPAINATEDTMLRTFGDHLRVEVTKAAERAAKRAAK